MDPGLLRDALTALLGVATGVLSGAFGVGGATISTPGIRALGASAIVAIGTTLPAIIPSALSGTFRYLREPDIIQWRAVAYTIPLGAAAAVGGSLLVKAIPGNGHYLQILTGLLLAVTAVRMGRSRQRTAAEREAAAGLATAPRLALIGVLAGGLSGLLGIGGGVVMVPAFNQLAGLQLKSAIATSLVCVGAFAIPGTITHAILGNIDWRFALWLTVGVIPGARIGAALAIRAGDRRLRYAVAGFLGIIAVIYIVGEILAL